MFSGPDEVIGPQLQHVPEIDDTSNTWEKITNCQGWVAHSSIGH